jgi:hypothetical protein
MERGEVIHGEISTADCTTAQPATLYTPSGTPRALAATETLVITDIIAVVEKQSRVDVFTDADGDGAVDVGERIVGGKVGAGAVLAMSFIANAFYCPRGKGVKVKSDLAGQVDVTFTGFVLRA